MKLWGLLKNLSENSSEILNFVSNEMMAGYEDFLKVGNIYSQDSDMEII